MSLCIRTATAGDAQIVSRIFAASWKHAYRDIVSSLYLSELAEDHWADFLEDGLTRATIRCLAAEDAGRPVAAAVFRRSSVAQFPLDGELLCLYALPEWVGRGAGRLLLTQVEADMRRSGHGHCVLDVLADNHPAMRFYERNGFRDTGLSVFAALGGEKYPCRILRKALDA